MIVISGIISVTDESRDDAVACLSNLKKTTLAGDEGVAAYRFGFDIENPNDIHVYEEWESIATLKTHLQKPHMEEFRQLRKKHNLATTGFSRWRAEELGEF